MQDTIWQIFGFITIAWLLLYLFKTNSKQKPVHRAKPKKLKTHSQPIPHYSAVSIDCSGAECEAARAIHGVRFLGREAPNLPLGECSSPMCECKYSHYLDRRNDNQERRLKAYSMTEDLMISEEYDQRLGLGRRASDWELAYQMNPSIN